MDLEEKDTRTNMEILANTISKAAEATEIADATLVTMAAQREQMLRIDDDLATINQTLANCEKRIKGISANFFTGLFVSNKGNAAQEVDTRYKASARAPAARERKTSAVPEELTLPQYVHDSAFCASDRSFQSFLESHKAKLEFASGEKVMFHYCNTRQLVVLDQNHKCILLSNQRLIRVLDGNVVNKVFLPDVSSVTHQPARVALGYDTLLFKYPSSREDAVEIWNGEVALFFKRMIDITVRARDERRRTRTDAELRATQRAGMSELERKFEEDKEQEDGQLEVLGKLVDGLGERAKAMGQELEAQKPIIDHLSDRMDATTDRVQGGQKKLEKILKS